MHHAKSCCWNINGALWGAGLLLLWPAAGSAQLLDSLVGQGNGVPPALTGQAAAVQATVFGVLGGTTLGLANTGTLTSPTDALAASQLTGDLLGALTAEVSQATTIGYPDQVDSAASLANLALSIAGNTINADFVSAEASAILNGAGVGTSSLSNLSLNGVPVAVTGAPNQTVGIPGGQMVINEQTASPGGIVVNALHVIVGGVADVAIGSAVASIQ